MSVAAKVDLALLTLSGLLLGLLTTFYLTVRIGGTPFPIAVLAAAVGNVVLLWLASSCTESGWRFAPLAAWGVVTLMGLGPGIRGNAALLDGPWSLLLLALGFGVPAVASAWFQPALRRKST